MTTGDHEREKVAWRLRMVGAVAFTSQALAATAGSGGGTRCADTGVRRGRRGTRNIRPVPVRTCLRFLIQFLYTRTQPVTILDILSHLKNHRTAPTRHTPLPSGIFTTHEPHAHMAYMGHAHSTDHHAPTAHASRVPPFNHAFGSALHRIWQMRSDLVASSTDPRMMPASGTSGRSVGSMTMVIG